MPRIESRCRLAAPEHEHIGGSGMKRRFIAGLMFVAAGILTVPAVGTAAAEELNSDDFVFCPDFPAPGDPVPAGCEFEDNTSSNLGTSSDLAALLGQLTNLLSSQS